MSEKDQNLYDAFAVLLRRELRAEIEPVHQKIDALADDMSEKFMNLGDDIKQRVGVLGQDMDDKFKKVTERFSIIDDKQDKMEAILNSHTEKIRDIRINVDIVREMLKKGAWRE